MEVRVDETDPHFVLTVGKYPEDAWNQADISVCGSGTHHARGGCASNAAGDGSGTALLDSRGLEPERLRFGCQRVVPILFDQGSSVLDAADM